MRADHGQLHHMPFQAPNLKTIALAKAMKTAIYSYDEQAFDNMSEESG